MNNEAHKKKFSVAFFEFISDPDGLTLDELRTDLTDLSIDTEKLEKRISAVIKKCSAERRLAWQQNAKNKREAIEKILASMIASGKDRNEDLRNRIKGVLEGRHGQKAFQHAEAYFRKVDSLSERDLASLLDDLEQLILLEEVKEKGI
jgi:hypothetical protein